MSPEKQEELYRKYPRIFKQEGLPVTQSCMGWGISCGDGWYLLIDQICQKIEEVYVQIPAEYKDELFLTAAQVKEKFGGLRFYIDASCGSRPRPAQLDALYQAINRAEAESMQTCEECGATGNRGGKYWMATLCEKHADLR